jgi:hypothetical protein
LLANLHSTGACVYGAIVCAIVNTRSQLFTSLCILFVLSVWQQLVSSRAVIDQAAAVVESRESKYRVPLHRIATWRDSGPTVYRYKHVFVFCHYTCMQLYDYNCETLGCSCCSVRAAVVCLL